MTNPIMALIQKYGDDAVKALVKKAPAIEGEVVGDLAIPAAKKVLPDIEAELVQKSPLMIEQNAGKIADIAEESAPYVKQTQSFKDTIDSLSPLQKGIGAAGIIGAASAPLFMGSENTETEGQHLVPQAKTVLPQPSVSSQSSKAVSKSSSTPAPRNEAPQTIAPTEASPVPQPENDFEQKLAAARDADRENQMLFGLLKAAQMGGSALASGKADTSYADKMLEDKNKFATQLKTDMDMTEQDRAVQEKNQLRDPNSDISKQARAMLGAVYPDLLAKNPNITAEQLEKMGMNLGSLATAKENIAARKEQAALQREMLKERKQDKLDMKQSENAVKHIDTYNKMLYKDYQNLQQAETNANRAKDIIAGNIGGVTPGAGDIAILYNFIKGLDKNSAVREGEIGLSKQARSVLGRLDSEVKRISGGDLLDSDTRAAFAELIDASAKAEKMNFVKQKRNAIKAGIEKGVDPETLDRALFADVPANLNGEKSTTIDSGIKTAPSMVKVISPEGKAGMIPAANLSKALERGFKEVK